MAPRGEAEDADAFRIDFQLVGVRTDGADGALGVAEWDWMVVLGAETVLEDDAGDAVGVQPGGNLLPFVVDRQSAVAAAGADDDGGAVGFLRGVNVNPREIRHIVAFSAGASVDAGVLWIAGPKWMKDVVGIDNNSFVFAANLLVAALADGSNAQRSDRQQCDSEHSFHRSPRHCDPAEQVAGWSL